MTDITILRLPDVLIKSGSKRSTLWQHIKAGLFVPPIKLGGRSSGFIKHEVDAIIAAHAVGMDDTKVKELVIKLVEKRKESASKLLQELVAMGG
ncbi:transcriptional regulator [Alteromonas sp. KS69]|uniref:helix-turn-helix transcriptional regulator n=1 Tax=Alteromonas sp. KS69 TaxID=2109917 RepID=UPI000F85CA95|nr:AlpA family phage regulatory protein [Alteromonas sp. KS69]RUP78609.1 transcriptional regulator [Alteromonas sp. KS69]|tara:strand:+ start:2127 stop:2408 length:282 start_codon:yes stop_codon:yes gene_type:complete